MGTSFKTLSEAGQPSHARDLGMAKALMGQIAISPFGQKVLAVYGDLHDRKSLPVGEISALGNWPSFANAMSVDNPDLTVKSLQIKFHTGTFYNFGVKHLVGTGSIDVSFISGGPGGEFDAILRLPSCSAARFPQPRNF